MFKKILPLVVLALFLSPTLAQNRPECPAPGSCFNDDGPTLSLFDFEGGDATIVTFPVTADDFIRVGPNGKIHGHVQDIQADIIVFPAMPTVGLYYLGGVSGQVNVTLIIPTGDEYPVTCPATFAYDGMVQDADLNWYAISRIYVSRKTPGGGCMAVHDDLTITPQ